PHAELSGNVTPPKYRELLDAARKAARIEQWPHNALRHSFASYHLAQFKDAAVLSLELGHTNSNLVFQHYRQLVRPKQAETYWTSWSRSKAIMRRPSARPVADISGPRTSCSERAAHALSYRLCCLTALFQSY